MTTIIGGKVENGGIILRVIPETSTAVSELMTGGIDIMDSIAMDQVELLRKRRTA